MANEVMERRTYTVEEAGQIIGLSRNGAYRLVRQGLIPTVQIGRKLFVPRAALDKLLDPLNQSQGGAAPRGTDN
jgi:excisionase family DNA binding protein